MFDWIENMLLCYESPWDEDSWEKKPACTDSSTVHFDQNFSHNI